MCADSSQYQHLSEINSPAIIPPKLKSPLQIANFAFDTSVSADEVVPESGQSDLDNLLRRDKVQQLLQCVGWEVRMYFDVELFIYCIIRYSSMG